MEKTVLANFRSFWSSDYDFDNPNRNCEVKSEEENKKEERKINKSEKRREKDQEIKWKELN